MPPVNTTSSRSPAAARPQTPPPPPAARPLTPLSYLSSPVPDLASTLFTSTAIEHADEANVTFLRDSLQSLDQMSQTSRRSHIDAQRDPRWREQQQTGEVPALSSSILPSQLDPSDIATQQERVRRVLARLNRLHEPSPPSTTAYSNRTPSPNRQTLYDWAPGSDETETEDTELLSILNDLRRQQPDTHPDILRILSQSQLETNRQRERDASALAAAERDMASAVDQLDRLERRSSVARRERDRRARETEWLSLRSRAMLQRARQDGAGSPSATERMLRYVMERERSGLSEEEERARGTGWFRPGSSSRETEDQDTTSSAAGRGHWMLPPPAELRERERQESLEAFRRGYLPESAPQRLPRVSTPPVPTTSASVPASATAMLENALKYLGDLRSCLRYEDSLSAAMDHGLATKEFFADKHDDFVMDLSELPSIPASSWLQPGAVLKGHQHATIANLTHQDRSSSNPRVEQINPNYRTPGFTGYDHPPGSTRVTPFDPTRPWQFTMSSPSSKESHDHWPVRVMIHSIDAEKMTLQGTMEAYDVPQHHPSSANQLPHAEPQRPPAKAGKKNAPITTYLEGHILDLKTHSFLTPSPPSTSQKRNPHIPQPESIPFPSATPQTDAQNWLKLPPFSDLAAFLSPSASAANVGTSTTQQAALDAARLLLSKRHLARLQEEYIFMRWKEKCFVHRLHGDPCTASPGERRSDQDRGHGLTISGFYYVSLRRGDGVVEGLYFDPASTPFQHLRLRGVGRGWGGWEFR